MSLLFPEAFYRFLLFSRSQFFYSTSQWVSVAIANKFGCLMAQLGLLREVFEKCSPGTSIKD